MNKEKIQNILEEHKKFLEGKGGKKADFSGVDLKNTDLMFVRLENANLENANLRNVKLYNANLENANLRGAKFYGSNLNNANLSGANLSGANLENTTLMNTNFTNANLKNVDFKGSVLENANLENANLENADLRKTYLENANLENANLRGVKLGEIDLDSSKNHYLINYFLKDLNYVLSNVSIDEIKNLMEKIKDGEIDETQYERQCCCLVGTPNKNNSNSTIPYYEKGLHNPSEQLFYQIREGDTPENNQFSKLAYDFCKKKLQEEKRK